MNELVSIITPMYKGALLVSDTINSVIAQSYTNWEMIIVDDCSPDNGEGAKVVQSFVQKDNRIKFIQLKKNKGSSGARNEAIRNANGRFLAFLDSDDIWHPYYLERMLIHIKNNCEKNAAIFYCGYRRMDSGCNKELLKPYKQVGIKYFEDLLRHCPIFPSAAIIDRNMIKSEVFFREELRALRDDYVYWLDIMKQGYCAVGYPDILVDYRMRDDSMTASKTKMIQPQWRIYRKILNFNMFKSAFYLFCWGINGIDKYGIMQKKQNVG